MEQIKPGALKGIKVLDFTWVYAGPFATRHLADMGAEVIKVDRYMVGSTERHYYLQLERNGVKQSSYATSLNRGKKSLSINLKSAEGKKLMIELIKEADILIENMSPGTMGGLGLGYEDMKKVNPRIIYCSISCFGQYGPYSKEPGYDVIAQSASGWTAQSDPVSQAPVAIGDCNSAMHAATAILAALYYREKTGIGQYIDISMTDCLFNLHEAYPPVYFFTNHEVMPVRIGRWHPVYAPYGIYQGRDGYLSIAAISEDTWKNFVKVMGSNYEYLLTHERTDQMTKRVSAEHSPFLHQIVEDWLMQQESVLETEKRLKAGGVPCMHVKSWVEVAEDPHTRARGMVVKMKQPFIGEIEAYGSPLKMSETFSGVTGYAPMIGEHNDNVLSSWLNMDNKEINGLYNREVLYKEDAVDRLPEELKRLGINPVQ